MRFRSLMDINKALIAKLWWNFRTSTGCLWGIYMGNNYCKKLHPLFSYSWGASHVWKATIQIRDDLEPHIWWQIKAANLCFWFGNWTRLGALYYFVGEMHKKMRWRWVLSLKMMLKK